MYFAAFGIFTDERTMGFHCPGAELVGVGHVEDWRIALRGCADTERSEGDVLPVLIWRVDEEHRRSLDMVEGYPRFYDRVTVHVVMADGTELDAFMYTMVHKDSESVSTYMLARVHQGWIEHGMDDEHLMAAVMRCRSEEEA